MTFALVAIVACLMTSGRIGAADPPPDFLRDVRPILAEHCLKCHGPDEAERAAGLRLDLRHAAVGLLDSGQRAIVPGDPAASELQRRIESSDPNVVMPPPDEKRPLSAGEREVLRRWIDNQAPYAEHWSFRPVVRPAVAALASSPIESPIDAFVFARLQSAGLDFAPEADRRTVMRRLSLDLTGLPPSPADVDEFVVDDAPDAYARLVDRLLASPRYGEKMAQSWLDLARFGDSSGYQDDGDRPSWPYRDYVIRAFNNGMPFDQYTIENLAGDLLPDPTVDQQVASGFNRLHRHNEEGGSDEDEFRAVYTVDRVNTTAATWLGLTLGCAQCHDHKYDPITQREYYSLFAFFNSLDGEVVINKNNRECHPFIRVPTADEQRQLDAFAVDLALLETQRNELMPAANTEFEVWLREEAERVRTDPTTSDLERGAVGGRLGRSSQSAYFADTMLSEPLGLNHALSASGRIHVSQSVNAEANVGYFREQSDQALTPVGFSVAEGPRFFAYLGGPDGERVVSEPLFGQHGVQYDWSFRYAPEGGVDDPADEDAAPEGLLTVELRRGTERIGSVQLDLSAADRAAPLLLDAFGLSVRGTNDADTPIELYVDDLAYVVSGEGDLRQQDFSRVHRLAWCAQSDRKA